MRWSGSGVILWCLGVLSMAVLGGCAHQMAPPPGMKAGASKASRANQQPLAETALPPTGASLTGATLDVREIKVIEDNGQQGVFVKLNHPATGLTHYTLAHPTRLVLDISGAGNGAASAKQYPVNNPLISNIRVVRNHGKIRLTLELLGSSVPTYTVNDLNDTIVAFLGEPSGGNKPVREQIVFTRRAVETAARDVPPVPPPPPAPQAIAATAPAPSPEASHPLGPSKLREERPEHPVYSGRHVSLDFKDADVHNVLRLLAEVSKLNIVATDDVKGKVTLRLFDVPWDQALDIVLQVLNLESERVGNVIRISTVKRLREEREELHKAQEAARSVEPLRVAYIHVNYAKAANLAKLISGASHAAGVAPGRGGQQEQGILTRRGSVLVDEYTNTLVVRDVQRGINNARELVRRLDVQTPEILIESSIVEATTNFERDLGIQWGYQSSLGPQTGQLTGANFPGTIGVGGSGLGTGSNGVPFIADFPATNVAPGGGSALDLALGSIDGSQALNMRLTALETVGKAKIISRPRVVTLNNVAATIKSITILRVPLPSTGTVINTGAGGAAGTASTATEKIETGIILVVTPQVSSDGYVLLDIYAKSSQADFTREVDNIPTEISREANSHILVKDGQTVVLGGIYRDNTANTETGIPFLRSIPVLGWLFRSIHKTDAREDLLVFLTPRILSRDRSANLPSADELWKNRS